MLRLIKYIIYIALLTGGTLMHINIGWTAGLTDYQPLLSADYWLAKDAAAEQLVLDAEGVREYNRTLAATSPTVYDLTQFPATVSGVSLRQNMATAAVLPSDAYLGGSPLTRQQLNELDAELGADRLTPTMLVSYGVTVRHTNLRTLPTEQGIFSSPNDRDFDILQETTLDVAEPVIILHQSRSGAYYYVQAQNYRGWARAADIGTAPRSLWLTYAEPTDFIVVTGRNLYFHLPEETVLGQMGSRLKLAAQPKDSYTVLLPRRDSNGELYEATLSLSRQSDVVVGYLPYTRANIIRQAFKFYGAPYGWGGLKASEDCSGFIADIYKTVGIRLPRNADEQETAAGRLYELSGLSAEQRLTLLNNEVRAGDGIYMNGHAMLYLGSSGGEPYIIHILGSYTQHYNDGTAEKIRVMRAVVSDLNLTNWQNKRYLEIIRRAVAFQ